MNKKQAEIEAGILENLTAVAILFDSPKSFKTHKDIAYGFYQGVCFAKCWDMDREFVEKILSMEAN